MIEFKNVTKIYYSKNQIIRAINNVSFRIEKGEFVCLTGKCGAGKTTLIKLLIAQEYPTEGEVFFEGQNVHSLNLKNLQRIRRQIGVVYQDYKLLESKTIKENLEYVMEVIGSSRKDIARDVPQVLQIIGLNQREEAMPEELSGGEAQCLAIGRALCHRPKVVIADEPTGNLDLENTERVIRLLKKINQMGTTLLLSTHNNNILQHLKNYRLLVLENGRLIKDTRPY